MGRRSFYARDNRGRFARTNSTYKRKASTRRKVAIAGAGALGVAAVAIGTHQAYRAGGRKGYEIGKKHGVYMGAPLRDKKTGRVRPNSDKKDFSQNPYARGFRPKSHGMQGARRNPTVGTRIRAGKVAIHKAEARHVAGKRARR